MAYQLENAAEVVVALLRRDPQASMAQISTNLGIHRHTLQRALRAGGVSLAGLKKTVVIQRFLLHCGGTAVPESLKEIWSEMGFTSGSTFARYVRRATGHSPKELCREIRLGHFARESAELFLDEGVGLTQS